MNLGRQKGRYLNVTAKKLLEQNPGLFSTDFNANKEQLRKLGILAGAIQERNKLAGEITSLVKRLRAEAEAREEKRAPAATTSEAAAEATV